MEKAYYRKLNDRSQNSSTYHKKDETAVRAKLKREAEKEIDNNAMHSDGDKLCLCPGGIGACGFGDPDTNICNHPRR